MPELVFLLDIDNTLLDNDRFVDDLSARLEQLFGAHECARYWQLLNGLREQTGYVDYLGALQQFRVALAQHPQIMEMSSFMLDYDFAANLYPQALLVIEHLKTLGRVAILSDGDAVFQPHKIRRAGLAAAVDGQVLIYIHKQAMLADIERRYPAEHYVMIDDKPNILADMKRGLGERLTTVFVRQGHYAAPASPATRPEPDIEISLIKNLLRQRREDFLPARIAIQRPKKQIYSEHISTPSIAPYT